MIALDRVERRFGPRVLFRDLSWLVTRGTRYGLVGPNGAGKTTLLRVLAGLDEPDAGAVHRPAGMRVGYLPQEVETLASGTVLGIVVDGHDEARELAPRLRALEDALGRLPPGSAALAQASAEYGALRHRFELAGGDVLEARARAVLHGLGVASEHHDAPLGRLSGGWRMRVALARLLVCEPDLLLLDEPTNHLDLDALEWLERFLDGFEGSFVIVSHDRYFLNRMAREIAELDRGRLTVFPGNYDAYLGELAARAEALEKAAKQQAREIAETERFIERFRYKATKARQVQSRIKALDRVERIAAPSGAKRVRFGFPQAPRSGDIVARAEGVAKSYGEREVYRALDLLLKRGDRVALVGPNGAGKSTLLKLLAGCVEPDRGRLDLGQGVLTQYYAQHQLEALDPAATVLESMERVCDPNDRPRMRSLLGCFLFSGDDVDKRVAVLSGGEKARLAIARMLVRPCNLLLLDEPTNHLDLKSREVLEDALAEWHGTLVLVSHDRYFINRVADTIAEVGPDGLEEYPGDYDTYVERRREVEAAREAREAHAAPREDAGSETRRQRDQRRAEADERNRRYRERVAFERRVAPIEREIETLEARIRDLETRQADPVVYRDPQRAAEVARDKAEAEARLPALYARWEALASETPG